MVKTTNKTRKNKRGGSLWGDNVCKDKVWRKESWEESPRLDQHWLSTRSSGEGTVKRPSDRTLFYDENNLERALKNKKFKQMLKNSFKGKKDPNYVKNCKLCYMTIRQKTLMIQIDFVQLMYKH